MRIALVRGDITEQDVDAVVNAASSTLLGGGGVAAARLATVYLCGERFNEGVFGQAARDCSIPAIIARLRTWHSTEC